MALLTAASMIMTAFTPVYAESTDDTAAVDWEKGDNIKAIKEKGVITVATGTYVPFEYRDDDNNIVGFDIDLAQYIADKLGGGYGSDRHGIPVHCSIHPERRI